MKKILAILFTTFAANSYAVCHTYNGNFDEPVLKSNYPNICGNDFARIVKLKNSTDNKSKTYIADSILREHARHAKLCVAIGALGSIYETKTDNAYNKIQTNKSALNITRTFINNSDELKNLYLANPSNIHSNHIDNLNTVSCEIHGQNILAVDRYF